MTESAARPRRARCSASECRRSRSMKTDTPLFATASRSSVRGSNMRTRTSPSWTQQATDHYREQNGRADRAELKAASIQAGAATGIPTEWKMVVGSSARRAARKTQKSAVGAKRSGTGSIGTRVPDSSSHSSIGAVRQASVRAPVRWGDELTWSRSARRGPAVAAVVQRREVLRQRGAGVRNYPTAESHELRDARSSDPPLTLPADGGRTRPHLRGGVIGKAYDTELKKGGHSCDSLST
jgi:hypothetical protein